MVLASGSAAKGSAIDLEVTGSGLVNYHFTPSLFPMMCSLLFVCIAMVHGHLDIHVRELPKTHEETEIIHISTRAELCTLATCLYPTLKVCHHLTHCLSVMIHVYPFHEPSAWFHPIPTYLSPNFTSQKL